MPKKYIVRLSETERQHLTEVIKKLQGTAQKARRAQVLLKADAGGPSWTDQRIAEAYQYGRKDPAAFCRGRLRASVGRPKTRIPADPEVIGWRTGSAHYRHALGIAAIGLRTLESAAVSRTGSGTGNCTGHQPRDRAQAD